MALTFSTYEDGLITVLKIAGQLDALSSPTIMPTVDKLIETKDNDIRVELSELDLIDSSGVATIVSLFKRGKAKGLKVEVTGATNQPLAIFKLLRMDKVFQIKS